MSASLVKKNHYPFSLIVSIVSIISFGTLAILSPEYGNGACVCDVAEDLAEVKLEVLLSVTS
jgi:hypothetical protein